MSRSNSTPVQFRQLPREFALASSAPDMMKASAVIPNSSFPAPGVHVGLVLGALAACEFQLKVPGLLQPVPHCTRLRASISSRKLLSR